ncbi:hypothetical protein KSF_022340 [Reticulibacter mediterranei]|uniref:OmpR/PhoB-type domain-containing protein n=1 Tax=Reticulibacter mediterranei TaxID=2778369 RepID=A0A8J3ID87_9CHLR|nr:winged helix-turn-helix domain-containing protein [Reticulibacter mediterranei]GHO92186.1 hypothetical protein KSF_022340 [Reticulibacter mediterranei]
MMPASSVSWETLPNPFRITDTSRAITGRVSGRNTDIRNIITSSQSAIILTGAPLIGKTTLVRYLNEAFQEHSTASTWSWRDESDLAILRQTIDLNHRYFVQIDLTSLSHFSQLNDIYQAFITKCIDALRQIHQLEHVTNLTGLKGLRELLRTMTQRYPEARYFVMLDAIERFSPKEIQFSDAAKSSEQAPQEYALSILNHSNIIRTLVDLLDEFVNFGVILSIASLPRPSMVDQFVHVSADLARFTTTTLQCFTWNDTAAFLAQKPEDFGEDWSQVFRNLGGGEIFTAREQEWIREQAGTHPYILHQLCWRMFHFKQISTSHHLQWCESTENLQKELIESVNERITPFLSLHWNRLQNVLDKSSPDTNNIFHSFITSFKQKQAEETISEGNWDGTGKELRYILANEGLLRYDPLRPIHYPGAILRNYLLQRAQPISQPHKAVASIPHGYWLTIQLPEQPRERLKLSELEYQLIKVLLQYPDKCSEEELMKAAWGETIEKARFTQRLHQLRKKLKEHSQNNELIINQYGGQYSLKHAEWLHLE